MPRPIKSRKVCHLPLLSEFIASKSTEAPKAAQEENKNVILSVDEYETIRLIDYEGFSQQSCGEYMQVARTTVQQIYSSARGKLAKALVEGKNLTISGGEYCLCGGIEEYCGCGGCSEHRRKREEKGSFYKMASAKSTDKLSSK